MQSTIKPLQLELLDVPNISVCSLPADSRSQKSDSVCTPPVNHTQTHTHADTHKHAAYHAGKTC